MRALILAPFAAAQLARLGARGVAVVHESWLDTRRIWDPEELGVRLHRDGFEVLVAEADFLFEEVFAQAPALRLAALCRNALNQVDLEAATSHGVAVIHTPARNSTAVAELTVGLMLALARHVTQAHHLVVGGGWRDPALGYRTLRGREVAGSTVGIVGFGQIGREVGRRCLALGARVVVSDPYVHTDAIRELGAEPRDLAPLAAESDFVTVHVPEQGQTRRLIDRTFMRAMRPSSYLINTSGGSVIDTEALVDALESRTIAGAALDVFEGHPLPQSSRLLTAPNVILTTHIGGATEETVERYSRMIADDIERLLDGAPLQHVVNPDYAMARAG